jgi:hypothetical protein
MLEFDEMTENTLFKSDWDLMQDIIDLLVPFEAATRQLCGENYQTIGHVLPATQGLVKAAKEVSLKTDCAKRIRDTLIASK